MNHNLELWRESLKEKISNLSGYDFSEIAEETYAFQKAWNPIFGGFVKNFTQRPYSFEFAPISIFKMQTVKTGVWQAKDIFYSSGTTKSQTSSHHVRDLGWYLTVASTIFQKRYGPISDYCFFALLPNYLERQGSSLVSMVDFFIRSSGYPESGFFLRDYQALHRRLMEAKERRLKTCLFGVSFALLDFLDEYKMEFADLLVIETGGMKGMRKEITRSELHHNLASGFGSLNIHSEYGMTELFSQAYSGYDGVFEPGQTMKVSVSEINDVRSEELDGKIGVLNIIDLANLDTCSFIRTDDLGRMIKGNTFEVLGRLDHSDLRGCNLLAFE